MQQWPTRCAKLCKLLNISAPIIQAPMAGVSTPAMVAAASEAGVLGSHGVAYKSGEQIAKDIAEVRSLTEKTFAMNVFVQKNHSVPSEDTLSAPRAAIAPYLSELGLKETAFKPTWQDYTKQLETLHEASVPVVSFTFGAMSEEHIAFLKSNGTTIVMGTATSVAEAIDLKQKGVDVIMAQGAEAGGHRGTYLGDFDTAMVGTMALVPMVVDAVGDTPVVAAGGIMDGRGVAASIALGASGAALGTAFISTAESAAQKDYKDALTDGRAANTLVTPVFSGRPARCIANRFTAEMADKPLAPFPIQHALLADLKTASKTQDTSLSMYLVGQGAPLSKQQSVKELVDTLVSDTKKAFF